MGYPYNGLIPAAVLLDNPGVTKEEFAELLNNCRTSSIGGVRKNAPWGSYGSRCEDKNLHRGLYGLAGILGLVDKSNAPEYLIIVPYKENGEWKQKYEVDIPKRVWGDLVEEIVKSFPPCKVGDMYRPDYGCGGRIEEVIEEDVYFPPDEERDTAEEILVPDDTTTLPYELNQEPVFIQRVKIKETWTQSTTKKFSSLSDLVAQFPQFDPEKMFDFSQKEGKLRTSVIFDSNIFWMQKDGKYYLDKASFDKMPACFCFGAGYTDLILTAEAIRHRAWKLLTYKGGGHIPAFLKRFPDSNQRYAQAIWDSHTSLHAKAKSMSYLDLIRFRLFSKSFLGKESGQD